MLLLNLSKAVEEIKRRKAKTVAVQLPEGLKQNVMQIVNELESKTKASVITFIDPCFGACDLADERAKSLQAQLLIHLGHNQFTPSRFPTIYIPFEYKLSEKRLNKLVLRLFKQLNLLNAGKIVLCSTIQYLNYLPFLKKKLEGKKLVVFIGKGKNVLQGQVLGCNYSAVKSVERNADAIVFFGDGLFHPLGISFVSEKKVLGVNPLSNEVKEFGEEREAFLRKRFAAIAKAKEASVFAALISTKKGQVRLQKALRIKKELEKKGKKVFLFASDLIIPAYLLGTNVEVLIDTACPRIALDDAIVFKQPILTPAEVDIVLGKRKLEEYAVEELE